MQQAMLSSLVTENSPEMGCHYHDCVCTGSDAISPARTIDDIIDESSRCRMSRNFRFWLNEL
jgi:hypothetical protein